MVVGWAMSTWGCQISAQEVADAHHPDWSARPLEDSPHSYELRRLMLTHLRIEWGGSEGQMLAFVRQQQDAGLLSATDMQRLWAEFHSHVSHHAHAFAHDTAKAVEHAQLAADLRDSAASQLFIATVAARRPEAGCRAALERYLKSTEQDADATPSGMFLWNRQWTLPDPLPALKRARDQGNGEAADVIVDLQEVGLGLNAALSSSPNKRSDILSAADLGSGEMSWRMYRSFDEYRTQFGLDDRARYRYLLRAADAGENDARFALAQQLRGGFVEVGDDGVLRPVDTPPLQGSLDYARHLLDRAGAEGNKGAQKALKKANDAAWDATTAKRIAVGGVLGEREASRGGRPWWQ